MLFLTSVQKLKLEEVVTVRIWKLDEHMEQCFSNLVKVELLNYSWKRIKNLLKYQMPKVEHVKITITEYLGPIELNIASHFPCARTFSFFLP